jgi:hypothetical protein
MLRLTLANWPTPAERIAALESELRVVRQQQRTALVTAIAAIIGPGVTFSARSLWQHRRLSPDLALALEDAGLRTTKQLGKALRALCGHGLELVKRENHGRRWAVSVASDWHGDAGPAAANRG